MSFRDPSTFSQIIVQKPNNVLVVCPFFIIHPILTNKMKCTLIFPSTKYKVAFKMNVYAILVFFGERFANYKQNSDETSKKSMFKTLDPSLCGQFHMSWTRRTPPSVLWRKMKSRFFTHSTTKRSCLALFGLITAPQPGIMDPPQLNVCYQNKMQWITEPIKTFNAFWKWREKFL